MEHKLNTEMFTISMVQLCTVQHIAECSQEMIINVELSYWPGASLLAVKSMELIGAVIIQRLLKNSKALFTLFCRLVSLVCFLVEQIFLDMKVFQHKISLFNSINLEYSIPFSEPIARSIILKENLGCNRKESKMLSESPFSSATA